MKDYIVYLSDGEILEQQAFDSKTLYESDQLIHFLREIFIKGFYNDKAGIENVII